MGCEYIEQHFKRGFTTNEIFDLLAVSHGIILSKRTFEKLMWLMWQPLFKGNWKHLLNVMVTDGYTKSVG